MIEPSKKRNSDLEIPEFHCTIPEQMLSKFEGSDKLMISTMSKLENKLDYLIRMVIEEREARLEMERRLQALEEWKAKLEQVPVKVEAMETKVNSLWDWHLNFSGRTAIVWGFVVIVTPLLLKLLFDLATRKGP
jgi:predicted RNase H-like nuclease (RuvC/YqgF family)